MNHIIWGSQVGVVMTASHLKFTYTGWSNRHMRKDLQNNISALWKNHFKWSRQPRSVNIVYRRRHYGTVNGVIISKDMLHGNKRHLSKPLKLQGGHLHCLISLYESGTTTLKYLYCGLCVLYCF